MDLQGQNGLLSTYREAYRARGLAAWVVTVGLIGFYLVLYFTSWLEPMAQAVGLKNQWFLYAFGYCFLMIGGGIYYLSHHGNSRYNKVRISVNILVQILLGFTVPYVMVLFDKKDYYFGYFWPLKIDYMYPSTLEQLPAYFILYSVLGALVFVPIMAIFFGKRWYCSWICGCGGLANTFGDPWRHLSDKSTKAWRFELISINAVMFLTFATTGLVIADYVMDSNAGWFTGMVAWIKEGYKFLITSILAGVVGVGFYPVMGPRVWCRYFCPMAAMLGLVQKVGRYRIKVKEDMCISCGNCSTYCEMGIDVRSYAQNNESFTRASCVGCGMCAHMCPRGVLKLEQVFEVQSDKKRTSLPVIDV